MQRAAYHAFIPIVVSVRMTHSHGKNQRHRLKLAWAENEIVSSQLFPLRNIMKSVERLNLEASSNLMYFPPNSFYFFLSTTD
jgi:hypothetical protein